MRIKYSLTIAVLLLIVSDLYACDVCNIFEYKPFNTNNYFGVFYHYRKFNGYNDLNQPNSFFSGKSNQFHELDGSNLFFEKKNRDYEKYQTIALRFNYRVFDHWNLLIVAPYETVEVYYDRVWDFTAPVSDTTMRLSGFGDVITAIDRSFSITHNRRKHNIRPGVAIKWATGKTDHVNEQGVLFDPELQTGTGSTDFIFRLNYLNMALKSGVGYSLSANYKWAGKGAQNYQFGDSWNAQMNLFYVFQKLEKQMNYIPKLGIYSESSAKNSKEGRLLDYTGGNSTFLNVGFDVQRKKWSAQLLYQQPVYQSRNGNQIGNAGRLNFSLIRSI